MKLLLDTHTVLWSIGKTGELSEMVKEHIKNPNNEILVSAVSLWEISLKKTIGKLKFGFELKNIPEYCRKMGFKLIPLEPLEAALSSQLPLKDNHKDPFDRMLIYQCIKNNYVLASKDDKIKMYKEYGLKYIW